MTTMRKHTAASRATQTRTHAPKDPLDAALAAEIRAELARRTDLSQEAIAKKVFNQKQQWLSPRVLGHIPFTGAQIKRLGDALEVNILDWYEAAKKRCPDPTGGEVTVAKPARNLELLLGGGEPSAPRGPRTLSVVNQ